MAPGAGERDHRRPRRRAGRGGGLRGPGPGPRRRVGFLAGRGRLEEAEPLLAALDAGGEAGAVARARYQVANARMREAFGLLARGELGKAGRR